MSNNEYISATPDVGTAGLHKQKPLYFLGVDAGGSKTDVLITDEFGNILGSGHTGCGNHQSDAVIAEQNINTAVEQALAISGLSKKEIAFAFFGLAGADREADYRILNPMIEAIGFPLWKIECDTMIALRAGSRLPHGVVLICGTGVNCAGRCIKGKEIQIGGFGYMYGDYGGGHDLASEAFRSVIRSWEGRDPETELTPLFLQLLDYPDVETMRDDFLDHPRHVPAKIVPSLHELALKGDICSKNIIQHQANELAVSAKTAIRRLGLQTESFDVVLAGSVLTKEPGTLLYDIIKNEVQSIAPLANVVRLASPPVIGAILRAMDEYGLDIGETIYQNLQNTTPAN